MVTTDKDLLEIEEQLEGVNSLCDYLEKLYIPQINLTKSDEYSNDNIIKFLKSAVATGASDEHLKVGYAPYIRKNGFIKKTNLPHLKN